MGQLSGFKYRDLIRKLRLPGLSLIVMPKAATVICKHNPADDQLFRDAY